MGWIWEVESYVNIHDGRGWRYVTSYTGNSLIAAVREMREAKRNGIGAIRLTWRPA